MGSWRKIIVDDSIPFSEDNFMLLPATTCEIELWPLILSKAIIKLANIETQNDSRGWLLCTSLAVHIYSSPLLYYGYLHVHELGKRELGEFTVLHTLTGWIPEIIPLRSGYLDKVWEFLRDVVPESKLPEESLIEPKLSVADTKKGSEIKNDIQSPVKQTEKPERAERAEKTGKEKLDQKEVGKKKSKDGEKVKLGVHPLRMSTDFPSSLQMFPEGFAAPLQPQMVLYACYAPLYVSERKIFELGKMADSSEKLRQYGLSHTFSHPALITRTRACPLIAPMKPLPIPRWKLIRQKKETIVTDEPQEPVFKKPEQFVEIASPFLNFKLYPISIPRDTHFSPAAFKKGSLPACSLSFVIENDENALDVPTDMPRMSTDENSQANSAGIWTPTPRVSYRGKDLHGDIWRFNVLGSLPFGLHHKPRGGEGRRGPEMSVLSWGAKRLSPASQFQSSSPGFDGMLPHVGLGHVQKAAQSNLCCHRSAFKLGQVKVSFRVSCSNAGSVRRNPEE
uniref:Uncharacterized protein n=1 Tax=Sphaerodactylus townsendi TaxID=933632 RepID=A0ACB8GBF9_9SAUR